MSHRENKVPVQYVRTLILVESKIPKSIIILGAIHKKVIKKGKTERLRTGQRFLLVSDQPLGRCAKSKKLANIIVGTFPPFY